LINLCNKERRTVPFFVEEIIKAIEIKGVDNDGLYRISGNLAEVQKLRCLVDQGKYQFNDSDIHVLTGTLKSFFREIEDPVIPKNMQEQFINALGNINPFLIIIRFNKLTISFLRCSR
jgi:Rho GTPase-activating protein 12/27